MDSCKTLADYLIAKGVLKTPRIAGAFAEIDRKDFVLDEYKDEAYGDYPLPIGYGQTISQPSTVAFMLELLQPRGGDRILDVGSGSGWTTALLGHIVGSAGKVYGVEIVPKLAELGLVNVKKYNMNWVEIAEAGDEAGLPSAAPFDRILVSASAKKLPEELLEQLKPEGVMVIPIGNSIFRLHKRTHGAIEQKEYSGFVFVPLKI